VKINKNNLVNALNSSSFPVLAASLVHITGDINILDKLPQPQTAMLGEVQGYFTDDQKEQVLQIALPIVEAYLLSERTNNFYIPKEQDLKRMMSYVVGSAVSDQYIPMMLEDINLVSKPLNPQSKGANSQNADNFSILIVGAGMSGILMGIKLLELGISVKIYEKNSDVGGTWFENSYPGCRVDIANHFYSYSFEENNQWSQYFSEQPELQDYFHKCFFKYNLNEITHFNQEVSALTFSDATNMWSVTSSCDEQPHVEEFNLVISCIGQLNQPKLPEINGLDLFEGKIFHSARWPKDLQLDGKKVAVIGSGASAFQIVPSIADQCSELKVFQRSPPWMFPNQDYHRKVDNQKKWLLEHIPGYSRWYRFLLFWPGSDQLLDSLFIDPAWEGADLSINASNEQMRQVFTEAMLAQITDLSLIDKVIPKYPPFGKRMLQDNGAWLKALHKKNVTLITDPIDEITSAGIKSNDQIDEFDTIILATGFKAQEFFSSMHVDGGVGAYRKQYGDAPESYLGITCNTLPNFFMTYGPGTNLAHAGSIIFNSECQVKYICTAIKHMLEHDLRSIRVKEEVLREYQARLEARLDQMVWQHPKVSSWYQNSQGKVVTTSPWRLVDYWEWTNNFKPSDYEL
jgi:4-hydroxyacetophenone monooxygenase|tara:strand:+ start:343 stop:2229 length:1887 start_codon:yes stop_codon:yes gene_type:complete